MKKTLLALLALSLFSCSNNSDPEPIPVPTDADLIAYFKGSLNGQTLNYYQENYLAPTHTYGFENGFVGDGFMRHFYYGCLMQPYPPTSNFYPNIDLTFNNLFHSTDYAEETTAFPTLLVTPPTNFLTQTQEDNHESGISVNYSNVNGTRYSSMYGDQTGSTMTVISSTAGTATGTNLKTRTIVGTVKCKLYNEVDPTDVITLTNGKYKLIFLEFD